MRHTTTVSSELAESIAAKLGQEDDFVTKQCQIMGNVTSNTTCS